MIEESLLEERKRLFLRCTQNPAFGTFSGEKVKLRGHKCIRRLWARRDTYKNLHEFLYEYNYQDFVFEQQAETYKHMMYYLAPPRSL